MAKDGKGPQTTEVKKDNSGRNRLLWSVAVGVVTYTLAVTAQSVLVVSKLIGEAGGWGVWVIAPMIAAALTGRMTLAWLRCRSASKSIAKERDLLMGHVRQLTYNINNPLNAITAHLVSLKTEFNPGSVEQIEISSRLISKLVSKLASLDVGMLKEAEAAAKTTGVDVEQMGRAGSL